MFLRLRIVYKKTFDRCFHITTIFFICILYIHHQIFISEKRNQYVIRTHKTSESGKLCDRINNVKKKVFFKKSTNIKK